MIGKPSILQTPYFLQDGRGHTLEKWLTDGQLDFSESHAHFVPCGDPIGTQYSMIGMRDAEYNQAWVVFHGPQVLQIVPEEVHSYWHHQDKRSPTFSGVWTIAESSWISTFNPRHLEGTKHFVLEFYDEIIEVICRDLIFGEGTFVIDAAIRQDSRLALAYLRRAETDEKRDDLAQAEADYRSFIACTQDDQLRDYAERRLNRLLGN